MKKWLLVCSVDAIGIDYDEIIESDTEPSFWDCHDIAQAHNCDYWSLEQI